VDSHHPHARQFADGYPVLPEGLRGLRLAFAVCMPKTGYVHPSGSRTDSPGIPRAVIQRADHTEERSYGSATTGGFDAADAPLEGSRRRPPAARRNRPHPRRRAHHPP